MKVYSQLGAFVPIAKGCTPRTVVLSAEEASELRHLVEARGSRRPSSTRAPAKWEAIRGGTSQAKLVDASEHPPDVDGLAILEEALKRDRGDPTITVEDDNGWTFSAEPCCPCGE
jgi:hypothetical protein